MSDIQNTTNDPRKMNLDQLFDMVDESDQQLRDKKAFSDSLDQMVDALSQEEALAFDNNDSQVTAMPTQSSPMPTADVVSTSQDVQEAPQQDTVTPSQSAESTMQDPQTVLQAQPAPAQPVESVMQDVGATLQNQSTMPSQPTEPAAIQQPVTQVPTPPDVTQQ